MAAWVDEWTCRTVNIDIVSFSLAELAGLDKIGWVVDGMERTMVEKVDVEEKFEKEEDWRPVFKVKLPGEGLKRGSARSCRRVMFAG